MTEENKSSMFAEPQWALVELLGRQRIVGQVSEATIAGGAFLRVDVPAHNGEKPFTRFYGSSSIYCLSPVSEEIARGMLHACHNVPVQRYELPLIEDKPVENDYQNGGDE